VKTSWVDRDELSVTTKVLQGSPRLKSSTRFFAKGTTWS
jgi:hypothetical protein